MSDENQGPRIVKGTGGTSVFQVGVWTMLGIILSIVWYSATHILPVVSDSHNDARYVKIGGFPHTGYVTEDERTNDLQRQLDVLNEVNKTLTQHEGWFKAIWEELREQNQRASSGSNSPKDPSIYAVIPGADRQPPSQNQ
jgi:hypothetical protein